MKTFALALLTLAATNALAEATTYATLDQALRCDAGYSELSSCVQNGIYRWDAKQYTPVSEPEYHASFCLKDGQTALDQVTLYVVSRRADGPYVRITAPFERDATADQSGYYFEEAHSITPGEGSSWMEYQVTSGDGVNYNRTIDFLPHTNDGQGFEIAVGGLVTFQCVSSAATRR